MPLDLLRNRSHYVVFIACLIQAVYSDLSDPVIQELSDNSNCSLTVKDNASEHALFREIIQSERTRVVFFYLTINNQTVEQRTISERYYDHDFYSLVRKDLGMAMISLPTDYIAISLNLYSIFTSEQSLDLIESTRGCYDELNDTQRQHIVFTTLLQFTNLNQGCYGQDCSTICLRSFNRLDGFFYRNVKYSCCNRRTINPKINISTCLTPKKQLWYVHAMRIISMMISYSMAAVVLDKLINKFLKELCSYRYFQQESHLTSDESQNYRLNQSTNNSCQELDQEEIHQSLLRSFHQISGTHGRFSNRMLSNSVNLPKMVKIRILDTLQSQNVNYLYFYDYAINYHWRKICYSIKLLSLVILSGGLGFISLLVQRNSTYFIFTPKFNKSEIIHNIPEISYIVVCAYGPYTVFFIVCLLKQIYSRDSKELYNQNGTNDQELLSRKIYLTPSHERQSYHQIKIILVDMKDHLLSLQLLLFIKDLLTLTACLPFCILGLIGLLRALFFIFEISTLKCKRNLLPNRRNWPLTYFLMSVIMTLYSMVLVLTAATILLFGIQLFLRIFITVVTFIFAFSAYFNQIIIIMIPYLHFIYQLLRAYFIRGPLISQRIIDVKSRIEENIQTILDSKQGVLRVNFIITQVANVSNVEIDIPEILNEEIIKDCIEVCIRRSVRDSHHHAVNGTSSIIFQYSQNMSDNNKVTVKLLQCGFGCVKCSFDNGYSTLAEIIETQLQNRDSYYFRSKLTQVYYDIYEDGAHKSVGIPAELYDYLKHYTPEISISQLQVAFNILIVTALFFFYTVTIFLVYKLRSISSLNSIVANTSIAYLATFLSLKYSKLLEIEKERIDKILILNITQYRRGYKTFFKRGIEFQPISQAISIAIG
ncbi:hypothetical protein TrispH2_008789 [Trichoplax sp. H2]|nr:hypothetical protein TrispH2_008789 [Trichoplax sp. H2]|eukprot:RDD39951.1 hypothetical protein TrispH2_008789 [Trichoplax sp. H2]